MITRLLVLNIGASALFLIGTYFGLVGAAFEADKTYMLEVICAVFLFGMYQVTVAGVKTAVFAEEFEVHHSLYHLNHSAFAETYKQEWNSALSPSSSVSNYLVLLGLIGTVVGFVIALSGVDPSKAGDASSVAPMVAKLIEGMSTALYTTLAGSIAHIWMSLNVSIITNQVRKNFVSVATCR